MENVSAGGYRIFEKKRTGRQFVMALFFIAVIAGGWRYHLLGYFIPLCMVLGVGWALFQGRRWCDWVCPRGAFFDSLIKPLSAKKEIPSFFKRWPLRVGMLSFLMLMMTYQIIKRWPDPYKIGMFFIILLTVTTVVGLILAFVFHRRTWCCFCPIGSMSNRVGRSKYPLRIDSRLCTECKLCRKVCPVQIAPFQFRKNGLETVRDGDCLKCRLCVETCPQKALSL